MAKIKNRQNPCKIKDLTILSILTKVEKYSKYRFWRPLLYQLSYTPVFGVLKTLLFYT